MDFVAINCERWAAINQIIKHCIGLQGNHPPPHRSRAPSEAEKGLLYPSLREQVRLLEPGGVLAENLAAVHEVQVQMGLVKAGAPLPRVEDEPLRQALAQL